MQGKVKVGPSTVAGGGVSLVAFVLALVAFVQGARDEATFSALAVGVVSLVTTLAGRYAQAVAQAVAHAVAHAFAQGLVADPLVWAPPEVPEAPVNGKTSSSPRPMVDFSAGALEVPGGGVPPEVAS
jgi:hypothetical protein